MVFEDVNILRHHTHRINVRYYVDFLQLQAKYESFETTASWTARAAEIEPDCADSGEIQTQTDYLSSNSPSFAEEDSPNTGNPFKPPPASLFVHGANASEDADNDRTGKANGFCTPENDWHATPSLNAVKDFTDILACKSVWCL